MCRPLPDFEPNDWNAIERAFAPFDSCALRQAWREEPEPNFQAARVRAGWRADALWVYAELDDLDIFNAATHLNDATYQLGDIFEIFVRPATQDTYFEFHVTPENQQLQLRWPDALAIANFGGGHQSLTPYFVEDFLHSQINVQVAHNRWRVLARVPASIAQSQSIRAGDVWMFSFSRYDCTRGVKEPVWSSTSPHAVPSFHRQHEWGHMTFAAP